MEMFAAGPRNPYDIVLHSNGNLDATGKPRMHDFLLHNTC